jgi:hydroxymethylglutaryl-CoA lyase
MPREKSFAALAEVIRVVGGRTPINVSLSTAFGCPMEGDVPQEVVLGWARRFADLGVRGLTICDTTGMAHPAQVARMCEEAQRRFPGLQLTLHFHNTRGMGLANVLAPCRPASCASTARWAAWAAAPMRPAPAATSPARDAVHMLAAMGYDTGIDFARLLQVARALPHIVGHEVPGQVVKAGPTTQLHPAPASVAELRAA